MTRRGRAPLAGARQISSDQMRQGISTLKAPQKKKGNSCVVDVIVVVICFVDVFSPFCFLPARFPCISAIQSVMRGIHFPGSAAGGLLMSKDNLRRESR